MWWSLAVEEKVEALVLVSPAPFLLVVIPKLLPVIHALVAVEGLWRWSIAAFFSFCAAPALLHFGPVAVRSCKISVAVEEEMEA